MDTLHFGLMAVATEVKVSCSSYACICADWVVFWVRLLGSSSTSDSLLCLAKMESSQLHQLFGWPSFLSLVQLWWCAGAPVQWWATDYCSDLSCICIASDLYSVPEWYCQTSLLGESDWPHILFTKQERVYTYYLLDSQVINAVDRLTFTANQLAVLAV
jgi:hypothetical protein